jgi:branched-subunit amino acid transport protein
VSVWLVVGAVGAATVGLKALGPVVLGGRDRTLPARAQGIVTLLAPVVLGALVATQVFGGDRALVVDARAVGIAAAGLALVARLPVLAVVTCAAVATALTRLVA